MKAPQWVQRRILYSVMSMNNEEDRGGLNLPFCFGTARKRTHRNIQKPLDENDSRAACCLIIISYMRESDYNKKWGVQREGAHKTT